MFLQSHPFHHNPKIMIKEKETRSTPKLQALLPALLCSHQKCLKGRVVLQLHSGETIALFLLNLRFKNNINRWSFTLKQTVPQRLSSVIVLVLGGHFLVHFLKWQPPPWSVNPQVMSLATLTLKRHVNQSCPTIYPV